MHDDSLPSPRWPGLRLAGLLAAIYLAVSAVLRLVLWVQFGTAAGVGLAKLPAILAIGAVNDAVTAVFLLLPMTLYLTLRPRRLARTRLYRWSIAGLVGAGIFALFYASAVEYFFFEEFDARFNLVAVDYLMYPHEVLVNIRDSYPVGTVILLTAAVTAACTALLWPALRRRLAPESPWRRRMAVLAAHGLLAVAASAYPIHALAGFENRVANELALNGFGSFAEALETQEIDYYAYYHSEDPQAMYDLLAHHLEAGGGHLTRAAEGRLDRRFEPRAGARLASFSDARRRRGPEHGEVKAASFGSPAAVNDAGPLNVVVIVEESFGAEFLGAYGADPSLSPEFDNLAEHGLLFTEAYATGTRTVRGLEAVVSSFPPIPSVSILRRPGNEGIANWGEVMTARGYHTSFLYGGYAYFDNMAYFFSRNGFEVSDRTDIAEPTFANIWGVSDGDLFDHAIEYYDDLDSRTRPFFSVVLTTSNHKPFTFPAGIPGIPDHGGGREAGVRYADHALGGFFRQAAGHPWFADTVFVVVADHGARVYGAAEVPLYSYEIPILIVAPGRLTPRRVAVPTSQIDVAPTVLGLLGEPWEAPFFGQDVLAARPTEPRTLLFSHNHKVALLRGREMVILGLRGQVTGNLYDREEHSFTPVAADPELVDLTTAYYQTAYDQFTHHLYR